MKHVLKTHDHYFREIVEGRKNFEVRFNDRNFCDGDELELVEIVPETLDKTGRVINADVVAVYTSIPGVEPGYCVMSIFVRTFKTQEHNDYNDVGEAGKILLHGLQGGW